MSLNLNQAIAQHLTEKGLPTFTCEVGKVVELRYVLCVVVKGRSARFVSKKEISKLMSQPTPLYWQVSSIGYSPRSCPNPTMRKLTGFNEFCPSNMDGVYLRAEAKSHPRQPFLFKIEEVGLYATDRQFYLAFVRDGAITLHTIQRHEASMLLSLSLQTGNPPTPAMLLLVRETA
jgi:hypothetical protein